MKLNSLIISSIRGISLKRCAIQGGSHQSRYYCAKRNPEPSIEFGESSSSDEQEQDNQNEGLSWEEEFRTKHFVPLTPLQKAIIYAGSGIAAFLDPTKAGGSKF